MNSVGHQMSSSFSGEQLENIHQRWVSTLDAIRDSIVVLDENDSIIRANRAFANLCDQDVKAIIHADIHRLLPWLGNGSRSVEPGNVSRPDGRMLCVTNHDDHPPEDGRLFILADISDAQALEQVEQRYADDNKERLIDTIDALVFALEKKDPYTAQHCEKVAKIAHDIAVELGFGIVDAIGIYNGARVHDIGKLGIPTGILNKPGRLAQAEMNLIRMHCDTGFAIVEHMEFPWPVHEIILQHHEKLDGSGYPNGLTKDDIHVGARIVAVADVFEAMSSHRPYRPALGTDAAIAELRRSRDVVLDAEVVDACISVYAGT